MSGVTITLRDGEVHEIAVTPGMNLMEMIRNAGLDEMLAPFAEDAAPARPVTSVSLLKMAVGSRQ
ncbi:hypothetical protein A7Q26_01780 [Sphingobium sp. TCM1]|jgi:hypothetical protein|nr:hypothetical protein A7Q26_01780 [Sphingobium sp. TCM1]